MRGFRLIIVAVIIVVGIGLLVTWRSRSREERLLYEAISKSLTNSGVEFDPDELKANVRAMSDRRRVKPPTYFPEGSIPELVDLCEVCRREGFPQIAEAVERQALPCFSLLAVSPEEVKTHGLTSKIGGEPNLPSTEVWPKHDGKSLSFIAQINLDEIPRSAASELLPAQGVLYFFYDAGQSPWGYDPEDKGSWCVLFRQEVPPDTAKTALPDDISEYSRHNEMKIKPVECRSVPDVLAFTSENDSLTEAQDYQLYDIFEQYEQRLRRSHQLLGHPMQIQGDMKLDCQLGSQGIYREDAAGYVGPEAQSLQEESSDWLLLLQVNSDDEAGMMWGDMGMLYFWIREEDLDARRFENVWMILQCY